MLNKLKSFGVNEGYFEIKRIGSFDNAAHEGISHINTKAIDFDKTTQTFCCEHEQQSYKSCDALDIIVSKNKVNFIEFKVLKDNATIEDWIEKLNLPQKIKDSREVVLSIVRKAKFRYKDKIKKFNSYEKNVIISFDLIDDARMKIAILSRSLTVREIIIKQFDENYIQGENFNDPVCIRMEKFDDEYSKYA